MLGYRVTLSPRRRGRDPPTICNTTRTQCNFSVPAATGRVYLSAYNAAGEAAPTEVTLLERKGEGSARNPRAPPGALLAPGEKRADAKPGCTGEVLPSPAIPAACPTQGSPWPGSGLCPGASAASGCTGGHRRPR